MASSGHEIGNHSFNHTADTSKLRGQVRLTDRIVKRITGHNTQLLRPPYGLISKPAKTSLKPVILWNVDSLDWKSRNVKKIYKLVMKNVRSGDIVILHDIYPTTAKATPKIVKKLRKEGYAFVTVSDIIGSPRDGHIYGEGSAAVRTTKSLNIYF